MNDLKNMPRGSTLQDFISAGISGKFLPTDPRELETMIFMIASAWAARRVEVAKENDTFTPERIQQLEALEAALKPFTEKASEEAFRAGKIHGGINAWFNIARGLEEWLNKRGQFSLPQIQTALTVFKALNPDVEKTLDERYGPKK